MYSAHYSCQTLMELEFSRQFFFFEKYTNIKLMKIRPVRAGFLLADRRTDRETNMAKLIVDFRNFANAPKNAL